MEIIIRCPEFCGDELEVIDFDYGDNYASLAIGIEQVQFGKTEAALLLMELGKFLRCGKKKFIPNSVVEGPWGK